MIKQTLDEWRAEATQRFGSRGRDWKFICPSCGHIQSGQSLIDAGLPEDEAQNMAYQGCIGRAIAGKGCNWAAYGFWGTLSKGRIVVSPDTGKDIEVFDFAPAEGIEKEVTTDDQTPEIQSND